MAIKLKCTVCRNDVASDAVSCPHCGHKEQLENERKWKKNAEEYKTPEYRKKNGLCVKCGNSCTVLRYEEEEITKHRTSFGDGETSHAPEGVDYYVYEIYNIMYCDKCNISYRKHIETLPYSRKVMEEKRKKEKEEEEKRKAYLLTPEGQEETKRKKEEYKKLHEKCELDKLRKRIEWYKNETAKIEWIMKHPTEPQSDAVGWRRYTQSFGKKCVDLLKDESLNLELEEKKAEKEWEEMKRKREEKEKQKYEDFERFRNSSFNKAMGFLSNPWAWRP